MQTFPRLDSAGTATRTMRVGGMAVFLLAALILGACGGDNGGTTKGSGSDTGSNTSEQQASDAVTMDGFAFRPASITVKAGTTVTWTNQDSTNHSVVAKDKSFSAPEPTKGFPKGKTFEHTFATPGTFPYECGIHSSMTGTVTVE